jgi:ABC-2 type transport system ATP-binding protein
MITARGLARRFTDRGRTVDAVRGVDIDLAPGELVAFLGPNGAGKTTTLRMLSTLLRPTEGTATIGGHDLLTDPAGVRRNVGYVAQGGGTVPERRVTEEIELQARLYGLSTSAARRRSAEMIERLDLVGLDQRLNRTLSGGQRRRLDIALGLVHSPGLLFLDEPTAGLDPQTRSNLWDHVRSIRADQGTAVFLTTHYLDEADSLADRVIVIDHGVIVAQGTPDQLKATVSGDELTVSVPVADVRRAAEVAAPLPGVGDVHVGADHVRLRVSNGPLAVPILMRALDAAGVTATAMNVRRPTLDDVFFTLTGRSLRDAGQLPARTVAGGTTGIEDTADVA